MLKTNQKSGKFLKFFAAVCVLCLMTLLGAVTVFAAGNGKISISSGTAERGGTVSVSVDMTENPGMCEMKLRLHYDSSALTLENVSTGTVFATNELTTSQSLSKNPYIVVCSSGDMVNKLNNLKTGNIITLNFKVSEDAECKSYAVTVEIQAINIEGKKCDFSAEDGSVSVVKCIHSNEWRVTTSATCEKAGTETLTCKKCSETFGTRNISAYNHKSTEIRNAKAATASSEGYTGDTYCKDCGKLISKGKAIEKLSSGVSTDKVIPPSDTDLPKSDKTESTTSNNTENSASNKTEGMTSGKTDNTTSNKTEDTTSNKTEDTTLDETESSKPNDNEHAIITGKNSVFDKNSKKSLAFVSDADFSEFVRVEIDGKILEKTNYTVENGSTIITISADFLNTLGKGTHTISIVSKTGTASTEFTVKETADTSSDADQSAPVTQDSENPTKSPKTTVVVIIVILILAAGTVGVVYFFKKRRG